MSKVEKGQKYNSTGTQNVYEILTDPITHGEDEYVLFADKYGVSTTLADTFKSTRNFILIREPKFKVGDRVVRYGDQILTVVNVSPETDSDGEFCYFVKIEGSGNYDVAYEKTSKLEKAA